VVRLAPDVLEQKAGRYHRAAGNDVRRKPVLNPRSSIGTAQQ
jgi:hypothetical protein